MEAVHLKLSWDFLGDPVVKNLPCNAGHTPHFVYPAGTCYENIQKKKKKKTKESKRPDEANIPVILTLS